MKKVVLLFLAILTLLSFACNTSDPADDNQLEVDAVLEEQATVGWEINEIVSSALEIEDITLDPSVIPENDISAYTSLSKLEAQAIEIMNSTGDRLPSQFFLAKPDADTLLYYADNPITGVRIAVYYDGSTEILSAYEVKYKFAAWQKMVYDSLELIINYNGTLGDGSDDRLQEVYRLQSFEEDFFVKRIISQVLVTHFVDLEITGLEAVVESYYNSNRYLVYLRQSIDLEPDETGTLREDFEFKDGKTAYHSITFNGDHTGTFAKQLRDGTTVTGSFNDVWDDNSGSFSEIIDFPSGRYIDLIHNTAQVAILPQDSIFMANLSRAIHFSDGRLDSCHVDFEIHWENGLKTTNFDISRDNGAHGLFVLEETTGMDLLNGQWTTWNDYFILITAEYYTDGSAHIHYEVYEPPYQEGNTAIIVADYYISPDGSGNGTIAHGGTHYQVNFISQDQAELILGGKKKIINLYR